MITFKRKDALLVIIGIAFSFVSSPVFAGPLVFSGQLDNIGADNGGAIYSGVPIGTEFSLEFDLVTGLGSISDGTTVTPFDAAFIGIEGANNEILDAGGAALINSLAGTNFVPGDTIDTITIESGRVTSGGGIIDVWVTYVLDPLAFDIVSPDNYPPDPGNILVTFFDIEEIDNLGLILYRATGVVDFDSIISPLCDFKMSQATYVDGDTVTSNVFRFANLTGADIATEIKIWLGVPGIPPISVTNVGADGSVVFPVGTDIDSGPLPLFPVTGLPRGSYELSCRMLDPVTGELLAEDLNLFDVQ